MPKSKHLPTPSQPSQNTTQILDSTPAHMHQSHDKTPALADPKPAKAPQIPVSHRVRAQP